MILIELNVTGQIIDQPSVRVIADSKNYVYVQFTFDDEWDGLVKTALFMKGTVAREVVLVDDMGLVPAEVMEGSGLLKIGVVGGDLLTTNPVYVKLEESSLFGAVPPDPESESQTYVKTYTDDTGIQFMRFNEDDVVEFYDGTEWHIMFEDEEVTRQEAELIRESNEDTRKENEIERNVFEEYNALTIYKVNNKVFYPVTGSAYVMHTFSGVAGTLPTDTNYWQIIAEKGEQGIQGIQGETGDEPAHEWSGTELRFQNPDGSWGSYTDLKGETGDVNLEQLGEVATRVSVAEKSIASILASNPSGSPVIAKDTYSDLSLPANAADAWMKAGLSGMTVTNLVRNGDFSNGTTGWTAWSNASIAESGGILSITGNGLGSELYAYQTTPAWISGHKYAIKIRARVTNAVCNIIRVYVNQQLVTLQLSPTENTWYEKFVVLDSTLSTQTCRIYHYYADAATASGKVMEVDYMMLIDRTALGLDLITDTAVLDAMFPHYIDGTVHAGATRWTSYDEDDNYISSTYSDDNPYRRLPNNTKDTIERKSDGTWKRVQRVSDGHTLVSGDFVSYDTSQPADRISLSYDTDYTSAFYTTGALMVTGSTNSFSTGNNNGDVNIYGYYIAASGLVRLTVPKGTYADIAAAQAALAGTVIYYQLATPIETDLPAVPALISKPNGTVIAEPCVCDVDAYGTGITVSGKVFSEISKVTILNLVDGTEEDVTADCTLNVGLDGFTCTSADADDLLWYELLLDTKYVALPENNYEYFDNNKVRIDSVTSKVYYRDWTVASGVITDTLTELT
jgi:hypothetical protein